MEKLKITEMRRLSVEEYKESEKLPLTVVLDDVRSMYNVGSIFRTCDAFRIEKILLCGITGCPPHQEIHKTALGAEDAVEWKYFKEAGDAIDYLHVNKYFVFAVEQCRGSVNPEEAIQIVRGRKTAIVLGNEVKGVRQEVVDKCDACIEIPQYGTKHSMNVAVAAGIVMWSLLKALQPPLVGKCAL